MPDQLFASLDPEDDLELDTVERELCRLDPTGDRVAQILRSTLDQLYDGQHTGRWSFDQLVKTEKTHMGTLVEINLHRAFGFADGLAMDYMIVGIDVDCKYSMRPSGWMLPPEVVGHLALLVTADDVMSTWSAGLIRVTREVLNLGTNRDAKGTLSAAGRARIRPLWADHRRLPENLILHLEPAVRDRIMNARAKRGNMHGQARVNELFRSVQRRIIRRAELATVAQQDDFMKRARGNGGARDALRPEGILVLGHQDSDPGVAQILGLPVPRKGELVSARVARIDIASPSMPTLELDGAAWRLATADDATFLAPVVPRKLWYDAKA